MNNLTKQIFRYLSLTTLCFSTLQAAAIALSPYEEMQQQVHNGVNTSNLYLNTDKKDSDKLIFKKAGTQEEIKISTKSKTKILWVMSMPQQKGMFLLEKKSNGSMRLVYYKSYTQNNNEIQLSSDKNIRKTIHTLGYHDNTIYTPSVSKDGNVMSLNARIIAKQSDGKEKEDHGYLTSQSYVYNQGKNSFERNIQQGITIKTSKPLQHTEVADKQNQVWLFDNGFFFLNADKHAKLAVKDMVPSIAYELGTSGGNTICNLKFNKTTKAIQLCTFNKNATTATFALYNVDWNDQLSTLEHNLQNPTDDQLIEKLSWDNLEDIDFGTNLEITRSLLWDTCNITYNKTDGNEVTTQRYTHHKKTECTLLLTVVSLIGLAVNEGVNSSSTPSTEKETDLNKLPQKKSTKTKTRKKPRRKKEKSKITSITSPYNKHRRS